jgi:hypothetical protein
MTISRLSLPQDFEDRISKRMLTVPIPDFFWAKLLKLAGVKFDLASLQAQDMGIMPERSPTNQGSDPGELANFQLMLDDPSGVQNLFLVSDEISQQGMGHTIRFNRPVFAGGGYTLANRTLNAGQSISVTPIDFQAEQTYLTLLRLAGPFASGGTVPQPYAIDRRDAKRAVHDLAKLAAQNLEFDREKLIDTAVTAILDAMIGAAFTDTGTTINQIFPGRGKKTAVAQLASPGDSEFDMETLLRGEQILDDRNVRRFANGKRGVVLTAQQVKQLSLDSDYKEYARYWDDKSPLKGIGLVGITPTLMVFRSTTLTKDTTTVAGNTIHHGYMFGPEAMGYGVGEPLEVVTSTDDNYGNQAKFVWQAMEAFGGLDTRYVLGLLSD